MAMRWWASLARGLRPALLAGVLALVVPGLAWQAETLAAAEVTDAQVTAAFLMNFTKFVEWPAGSNGSLVICIAGDDALAEIAAETMRGHSFNGREFQTRRLASRDDPSGCQVLFVGAIRPQDAAELMQHVNGPMLTVGETVQFLRDGGMVRIYVENRKMRFQISQKNAEAKGLKVSSRLLMLAAQ
jgi:hypothetical protein